MDESPAPKPGEVAFGELPELTRALRALGSSRRSAARRKAAAARTPTARLIAVDATELESSLDRALDRIAAQWPDERESARRAIRAQVDERVREYRAALAHLRVLARQASESDEAGQLSAWREWTVQLQLTFQAADRSWIAIQSVVDALTAKRPR
jgi:hypothetical protein